MDGYILQSSSGLVSRYPPGFVATYDLNFSRQQCTRWSPSIRYASCLGVAQVLPEFKGGVGTPQANPHVRFHQICHLFLVLVTLFLLEFETMLFLGKDLLLPDS
jgi:hypothetical protein